MATTLFDEPVKAKKTVEAVERIEWWNATAHRLNKLPDGWRWFAIDAHNKPDDFVEIRGGVPIGTIRSGKRKGETKWPPMSQCQTLWLRISDRDETMRLWEAKTGKCSKCCGSGQEFGGWSAIAGTTYRDCNKCQATGKV